MQALLDKLFANQALAQAESHRFLVKLLKAMYQMNNLLLP